METHSSKFQTRGFPCMLFSYLVDASPNLSTFDILSIPRFEHPFWYVRTWSNTTVWGPTFFNASRRTLTAMALLHCSWWSIWHKSGTSHIRFSPKVPEVEHSWAGCPWNSGRWTDFRGIVTVHKWGNAPQWNRKFQGPHWSVFEVYLLQNHEMLGYLALSISNKKLPWHLFGNRGFVLSDCQLFWVLGCFSTCIYAGGLNSHWFPVH